MSKLVVFKSKTFNVNRVKMIESRGYRFVVSMFKRGQVLMYFRRNNENII